MEDGDVLLLTSIESYTTTGSDISSSEVHTQKVGEFDSQRLNFLSWNYVPPIYNPVWLLTGQLRRQSLIYIRSAHSASTLYGSPLAATMLSSVSDRANGAIAMSHFGSQLSGHSRSRCVRWEPRR